jgi:hypothetical protein
MTLRGLYMYLQTSPDNFLYHLNYQAGHSPNAYMCSHLCRFPISLFLLALDPMTTKQKMNLYGTHQPMFYPSPTHTRAGLYELCQHLSVLKQGCLHIHKHTNTHKHTQTHTQMMTITKSCMYARNSQTAGNKHTYPKCVHYAPPSLSPSHPICMHTHLSLPPISSAFFLAWSQVSKSSIQAYLLSTHIHMQDQSWV